RGSSSTAPNWSIGLTPIFSHLRELSHDCLRALQSLGAGRGRPGFERWILVIEFAVEASTGLFFLDAAPLFEEKRNIRCPALSKYGVDPAFLYWPRAISALSSDDDPVDPIQVDLPKIFQQRFYRQKPHCRRCFLKLCDSRNTVFPIFDADTEPNVVQVLDGRYGRSQ